MYIRGRRQRQQVAAPRFIELVDPVRRSQFSSPLATNMVWEPWELWELWELCGPAADLTDSGGLCPHLVFAPSLGESEAGDCGQQGSTQKHCHSCLFC